MVSDPPFPHQDFQELRKTWSSGAQTPTRRPSQLHPRRARPMSWCSSLPRLPWHCDAIVPSAATLLQTGIYLICWSHLVILCAGSVFRATALAINRIPILLPWRSTNILLYIVWFSTILVFARFCVRPVCSFCGVCDPPAARFFYHVCVVITGQVFYHFGLLRSTISLPLCVLPLRPPAFYHFGLLRSTVVVFACFSF